MFTFLSEQKLEAHHLTSQTIFQYPLQLRKLNYLILLFKIYLRLPLLLMSLFKNEVFIMRIINKTELNLIFLIEP